MNNDKTINLKPIEFLLTNVMPPGDLAGLIDDMIFDFILMYFKLENMKENIIGEKAEVYLFFLKNLRDALKECSINKSKTK